MSKKRPTCPECQSKKIVPIQYGMPSIEMYEKSKLGKFVLGGCCMSDESTKWHCLDCEHEFGKYFVDIETLELPELDDFIPLKLEFIIGGYDLPSRYCVKLEGDVLKYGHVYNTDIVAIIPTRRKWINFKNKLDAIGVWKWKKKYVNNNVLDGTQWELEIVYSVKMIKVYGDNKYPGSIDPIDSNQTPEFKAFLHALGLLLGGVKL